METPILNRSNVTSLLNTDTLMETLWLNCKRPNDMIIMVENFCLEYPYCEIVIHEDGESLGIIVDAYNGKDNMDSVTIWYKDF